MSDRQRFADVAALVTGGGSGIGRATAEAFAAEGARVAVLDRDDATAEATAAALRAAGAESLAVVADITDEPAVVRAVAEAAAALGPIGVLINNAGATFTDSFEELDAARWRREVELNLTGAYLVTRAIVPGMLAQNSGSIVNVATVNAVTALSEPAYSAAKAGLLQLTRQLATHYAPRGIRTNAVIPGSIRTPIWERRLRERPEIFDVLRRWYPVGRIGEPADVAAAILFLASPEAGFINGAALPVDGGLLAGLPEMTHDILGRA